jgi:hypothetical protein
MNKRLLLALGLTLLSLTAFADIGTRIVDLGYDVTAGASNNYFSIGDITQETLVIDFNDIVSKLGANGFCLTADADAAFFLNVNPNKNLSIGVFANATGSAYTSFPKSLFDLLANGNSADTAYTADITANASLYANLGMQAKAKVGKVTVWLKPVYFMPLVYAQGATASYSLSTDSVNGTVTASGTVDAPVYSIVSLDSLQNGVDPSAIISPLLNSGGFDISLDAAYDLLPELAVGLSLTQIPILPAHLSQKNMLSANFSASVEDILGQLGSSDASYYTTDYDYAFTASEEAIAIRRPFKCGAFCTYTPKGVFSFFSAKPWLNLVMDGAAVSMDGGVKAQANFANLLRVNLSSSYANYVWEERLGLEFNVRLLELDIGLSSISANFLNSFLLSGARLEVGMHLGF